jgi:hypothetical protein
MYSVTKQLTVQNIGGVGTAGGMTFYFFCSRRGFRGENVRPLNNGVSIVQKLVVKLSNTSTMLFPPVAKTLSSLVKCLRVCHQVFELWTHRFLADI